MFHRALRRGLALAAFTFSTALLPGCGGNGSSAPSPTPTPAPVDPSASAPTPAASTPTGGGSTTPVAGQAKWTYMVFLAGDNNLTPAAVLNLQQMLNAKSSNDVNVVVQIEMSPKENPQAPKTTMRGRVKNGNLEFQDMGRNVDMTQGASLTDFVTWTKQTYPAQHYVVDLWSHGGGWRNSGARRGVLVDETSAPGKVMSIATVAEAMKAAGKVDILAFDACLMGMYEVAYGMKDTADWLVASEESIPGNGLPYDAVVNRIVSAPNVSAKALAEGIVQDYKAYYTASPESTNGLNPHLSSIDLGQMGALHTKVQAFATSLSAHLGTQRLAIEAARDAAPTFSTGSDRDLAKFADEVATRSSETALRSSASAVAAAVRSAVTATEQVVVPTAENPRSKGTVGLAIFIPKAADVSGAMLDTYSALPSNAAAAQGAGQKAWGQFARELVTGNGTAPGQTQTSGSFGYFITWDNAQVDLDLLVNEPQGNWAGPAAGSTSENAFSSADSWTSGKTAEYYVANDQLFSGQYDVFATYAGCHKGYTTCGNTTVQVYRLDPKKGDTDWVLIGTRVMSATPALPALPDDATWGDLLSLIGSNRYADWYYPGSVQRSSLAAAKPDFRQPKRLDKHKGQSGEAVQK